MLDRLAAEIGPKLALLPGAARVWWPNLTRSSAPADHPMIMVLDEQHPASTLGEIARQIDLSKPHVRREMRALKARLAYVERSLDHALDLVAELEETVHDAHRDRDNIELRAVNPQRLLPASDCPRTEES